MRADQISPPISHPHVAIIDIDPVQFSRIERLVGDRPEVRLLHVDDDRPDSWTLHIGCASDEIRRRVEDGWG